MTDQEVIETLARRGGWTVGEMAAWIDWKEADRQHQCAEIGDAEWLDRHLRKEVREMPPYLTSRDSIAPVLAGLTDEEWRLLDLEYFRQFAMGRVNFTKAILTLPPADLARAVAEVLKGGK